VKGEAADALEGVKHPHPVDGAGTEVAPVAPVEIPVQLLDGEKARQVPLVELEHQRNIGEVDPHVLQVLLQVLQALDVGFPHGALGVGHEDDAVHALEYHPPGLPVENLARNGVELEPRLEAGDDPHLQGQKVKKERAVRLGLQRDHLAPRLGRRLVVDVLEVGRLSAEARAVVDHLGGHLHCRVIEKGHPIPPA
jgi:hypothetical protein